MQLIFELRRDVTNLWFRMEHMDAKLNLLLNLCSHSMAHKPALDLDLPNMTILNVPILLHPGHSID
jgi:hypothetical protein